MALVVAGISVVQGYVLAQSAVAVSCGADTTEDILATIAVPAGALGINGSLRIWPVFSFTINGNNKTVRVRYSGTAGTQYVVSTFTNAGGHSPLVVIANRGAANSQIGNFPSTVTSGLGQWAGGSAVTSAVDTTIASSIVLTGQKASAGDTLKLESYLVELFPTA